MRSPDFFRGRDVVGRSALAALIGVGVGSSAIDAFSAPLPPLSDQRPGIVQSGSLPRFTDQRFRMEAFFPTPEASLEFSQAFSELSVSEEYLKHAPEALTRVRAFPTENGDTDELVTIAGLDSITDVPGTMKRSRLHLDRGFLPFEQAFHQPEFRPLDIVRDSERYYVSGIQVKKQDLPSVPLHETRPVFAVAAAGENALTEIPLPDALMVNLPDGIIHDMVPIPNTPFVYVNIEYSYKGTRTPTIETKQAFFNRETQHFLPIESNGKGKRRQHMTLLEQTETTAVFVGMEEEQNSGRSVIKTQMNLQTGKEYITAFTYVANNVSGFLPFTTAQSRTCIAYTTAAGRFGIVDMETMAGSEQNANQWVNNQENTIQNSAFLGSIQVVQRTDGARALVAVGSFAQEEPYQRRLLVAHVPLVAGGKPSYTPGIAHPRISLFTTRQESTQRVRIGKKEGIIGIMDNLGLQVTSETGEVQYIHTNGKPSSHTLFLPVIARSG